MDNFCQITVADIPGMRESIEELLSYYYEGAVIETHVGGGHWEGVEETSLKITAIIPKTASNTEQIPDEVAYLMGEYGEDAAHLVLAGPDVETFVGLVYAVNTGE